MEVGAAVLLCSMRSLPPRALPLTVRFCQASIASISQQLPRSLRATAFMECRRESSETLITGLFLEEYPDKP